jgi:squalene-hopene/tetraprenyl-beta-curcumene cyclase
MRSRTAGAILLLSGLFLCMAVSRTATVEGASSGASVAAAGWNKQAAAQYLDQRETWWQAWPRAQKDHGTLCISCHTVVPYAMVRPELQRDLGDTAMTAPEKVMLDSVEKRVGDWAEMAPFYSDEKYGKGKAAESRATEAVLNVVILASYDAAQGQLRPITRKAFDEVWALQEADGPLAGGWKWQDFHLGPWESTESGYQGAALLMVEAVHLPGGFAQEPETREHLDLLRDYLRRNYAAQPLVNQLYILWASAKEPGLLTRPERKTLMEALRTRQQADGGFRTSALDVRERVDHTAQPTTSDGYATGIAVLALEAVGTPRGDAMLSRSLAWLAQHQQSDGTWTAASLNKQRDPASDPALFMTDAATAYAVLALEQQP